MEILNRENLNLYSIHGTLLETYFLNSPFKILKNCNISWKIKNCKFVLSDADLFPGPEFPSSMTNYDKTHDIIKILLWNVLPCAGKQRKTYIQIIIRSIFAVLHIWRVASMSFNLMPASVASLTRTLLQSFIKLKSWFEIERL